MCSVQKTRNEHMTTCQTEGPIDSLASASSAMPRTCLLRCDELVVGSGQRLDVDSQEPNPLIEQGTQRDRSATGAATTTGRTITTTAGCDGLRTHVRRGRLMSLAQALGRGTSIVIRGFARWPGRVRQPTVMSHWGRRTTSPRRDEERQEDARWKGCRTLSRGGPGRAACLHASPAPGRLGSLGLPRSAQSSTTVGEASLPSTDRPRRACVRRYVR